MSAYKWFINEDGGVYPYNPETQAEEFPNDYPVAYDSVNEAWEAAKTVKPWHPSVEDIDEAIDSVFEDDDTYTSGEQYMADYLNSDSNINYLNGH